MLTPNERRIHQSYEDAREREACGEEREVTCFECDNGLDEDTAHVLEGTTYCAACALHEATRAHFLDNDWGKRPQAQQLERLEVFQAAAAELERSIRAAIRNRKGA